MKKILIVDGDKKTPFYYNELCKLGFYVLWIKDADDVLITLKSSHFDVIILEMIMQIPKDWDSDKRRRSELGLSTGEVLFQEIRVLFPKIPIIIHTAKKLDIKMDEYLRYLQKPSLISEIVDCLTSVLPILDKNSL